MSGHYRTLTYFTLNAIALSLLFICAAQAQDKDAPLITESITLPADGALDSEGNPLVIPDNPIGALNYRASPTQPKSRRDKKSTQKPKNKRSKKLSHKQLSRKQQLASRQHVADDPSCRWLDKRMSHLEKSLKRQAKQDYGYQDKELRARQSEWVCMKCGAEGPSQSDHHKCQYRR
ncbi:hypothetical protein K0I63_18965 [Shewanella rhizosphaerae]|uniref:hypothetical protein n=1 Tax=Shewanella rhizosphaerae TaxID=2864207 RepID=UPI001C6602B8|nr:hypothetical protein [Shewanella rhizosphaerae]QYK12776.1 hypothetical protein K0I63_18965 [Shewanella rhizosphaerae]